MHTCECKSLRIYECARRLSAHARVYSTPIVAYVSRGGNKTPEQRSAIATPRPAHNTRGYYESRINVHTTTSAAKKQLSSSRAGNINIDLIRRVTRSNCRSLQAAGTDHGS